MTHSFDYHSPAGGTERPQSEPAGDRVSPRTATRADLLNVVAAQCPNVSRAETRVLIEMALEEMTNALARGEAVKLRSFGHFSVRAKRQRMGRNPRTGTEVPITPRRVLTFKASPVLLEAVNRRSRRKPRAH